MQDNYYQENQQNQNRKKPKKKRRFGIVKFVLAALFVGAFAGAGYQGYRYFNPDNEIRVKLNTNIEEDKELDIVSQVKSEADVDGEVVVVDGVVTDVTNIVDNLMPSIVAINASGTDTLIDFWGRRLTRPFEGSGSGIIIGQSEEHILIVTNNHVISGAQQVEIVFEDDSTAMANVKGADARTDLAVLEVPIKELEAETIDSIRVAVLGDSNSLELGEMVVAIGNALGYGQSVTLGYISALGREVEIEGVMMKLIQTDAAINPGNSGGALINTRGQVIGINTVKNVGQAVEGMGYAIPITEAIPMIEMLMNREAVTDIKDMGFLGIMLTSAQNITEEFAQRFNMPVGIYVDEIVEDSPAEEAGLETGHIIVGADGIKIETVDDLLNILSYTKPGEELIIEVKELEGDQYVDKEISVVLGKRPN